MRVLVTGGSGFLGGALCRALVERGDEVTAYQRSHSPVLQALGVRQVQGDLTDSAALQAACARQDAVLHNAAKAGAWGSYDSYYQANVIGTRNVIEACRAQGVRRLVHTSTPSVTHSGRQPVQGGNERDTPYGTNFKAPYPATKRIAEQEMLAANGPELSTVSLRPRLIWGPGDTQLLPRLVERARAGGGPTLIEGLTYRIESHTNSDDPTRYRKAREVEHWKRRDPIERLEKYLVSEGALSDATRAEIAEAAEALAAETRDVMTREAVLDPLELFDHVYSRPRAALLEQRAALEAELAGAAR